MKEPSFNIAIIGSGPSALMAADVISKEGYKVSIFEKRNAPARKLLIAGSSGLNVTHSMPIAEFPKKYSGNSQFWSHLFSRFSSKNWLDFIQELGINTFEGTSQRYFVEGLKAVNLVNQWKTKLTERGVKWFFDKRCINFQHNNTGEVNLFFEDGTNFTFRAVVFCLGGGSWEPANEPVQWPRMFLRKKIGFTPFTPSNCGFTIHFNPKFLTEAEGQPIKNVILKSSKGSAQGDLVVTAYGFEGTPVYAVGAEETVFIDLKPDLTEKTILSKLNKSKENLNPIRRIKKYLNLSPASLAFIYHHSTDEELNNLEILVPKLKNFPVEFKNPQTLEWAISSAGGIKLDELTENFEFKNFPGVFAAGEMLDWDTVTGGFLIQACVSQGFCAGLGVVDFLKKLR